MENLDKVSEKKYHKSLLIAVLKILFLISICPLGI